MADVDPSIFENPFVKTPSKDEQDRAIETMNEYFQDAKRLTQPRRDMMVKIYEGLSTFDTPKRREWDTDFKVNKGFIAVTKWVSRLTANRFKWIVSRKMDATGRLIPQEDVDAINDVLASIFDRESVWKRVKMWVKKCVTYGPAWAKPRFEMRTVYLGLDNLNDETSERKTQDRVDERADAKGDKQPPAKGVEEIQEQAFREEFLDEFPTLDPLSFSDVYVDPRYLFDDEIPALMQNIDKVRWASIIRNKKLYFNINQVDPTASEGTDLSNESKMQMYNIQATQGAGDGLKLDRNSLNIKRYYGVFSRTGRPEDEKFYKLTGLSNGNSVNLLIQMKEIKSIPGVLMKCFEDVETMHAYGVVEPQKGLEDELNFQKNSKAMYINAALNRNWLWSVLSGVKPSQLNSSPNNIIVCKDGVPTAKRHLEQLEMPPLNNDIFASENDLERQIQEITFLTSVSNPNSAQNLTNTATGVKAAVFDTSSVINDVRKNMENAVVELAYQMLELLFDNIGDNWVVERIGEERYFRIQRTLFQNPRAKYNIQIEANSSVFDNAENKRTDALAFWEIAKDAKKAGVNIDLAAVFKDVVETFEKRKASDIIKPDIDGLLPGAEGKGQAISAGGRKTVAAASGKKTEAQKAVESIRA